MSNGNDKNPFPESGMPYDGPPEEGTLDTGGPAVAAAPRKMLVILILAAVFIFFVMRSLFFSNETPKEQPVVRAPETVTAAPPQSSALLPPSGILPTPPPPEPIASQQTVPPPPPAPIPPPPTPTINSGPSPHDEALKARIRSSMIVSGGSMTGHSGEKKKHTSAPTGGDSNLAFANNLEDSNLGDKVEATNVGNLNTLVLQGKVIPAVLESAINSDLPGPIRAVVSHDVYAEAGRAILIPKGSRLIGSYNSSVKRGQGRVFIIWTRVIRPDGIDVAINSPGVDTLGRAGQGGDVDNKYFEVFSAAILTSALDIGVAAAGQGLFGNQQQTTTTGGGGTTTTSSPSATAMQGSVQNIGDVGKTIVGNVLNLSPTISIDQGTEVNVFVNRDLSFPNQGSGHVIE